MELAIVRSDPSEHAGGATRDQGAPETVLEDLVERAGRFVLATDPQHRITSANAAWFRATGHDPSVLGRLRLEDVVCEGQWPSLLRRMDEVVEHGSTVEIEARILRSDGVDIEVLGTVVPDGHRSARMLLLDVTERKRERARQAEVAKLERVGQLTAAIGHDFGNVFAVVNMNAEMLQARLMSEGGDRFEVEQILGAADDGMKMVSNLMAIKRSRSYIPVPVDPFLLASLLEEPLRTKMASTIELEIVDNGHGRPIMVDTRGVEQVLSELVSNAVDAMDGRGRIRIEVGEEGADPYADQVRITVRDDGQGMTREVVEQVFDPLYSKKNTGRGLGLGLPVARRVLHNMDGHIAVESEPGTGTAVHVFFPSAENETA